jgi:uncharacterized protein (TIGR03790 family)
MQLPMRNAAYSIGRRGAFQLAALLCALAAATADAGGERHPEVLVVVNDESAISRAIGEHYRTTRGVPARNVVHLSIPLTDPTFTTWAHETVSRQRYQREIRDPIAAFLASAKTAGEIEIIVTTKGVPLRIHEEGGPADKPYELRNRASVDAEIAVLGSDLEGSPGFGTSVNPYFGSDEPFASWRSRHPRAPLRYLVARITGYESPVDPHTGVPADVTAMLAAARSDGGDGPYLVDEDPTQPVGRMPGNLLLLAPTAAALGALGLPVLHDRGETFLGDVEDLVGYASWGSNDLHHQGPPFYGRVDGRLIPGRFGPRAISADLVSTNMRSFTRSQTYGQSLVADLLALGVAGAAGTVYEPTLTAVVRPYHLFGAWARGVRAVEAYFRSVAFLGWTNAWVGDPLMRIQRPVTAAPEDRDGDSVPDGLDNCLVLPNPEQRDTDGDGFGNLCDADFDGDGRVTTSYGARPPGDLERLERAVARGFYIPRFDLDGNGAVDAADLAIASIGLYLPPGPSGRSARGGQAQDEAGAAAGSAALLEHAGVLEGDVERDGEAEAHARVGALRREEGVEDALPRAIRNAGSVVLHGDLDPAAIGADLDADAPGGRRIQGLAGVLDQVEHDLDEALGRSAHRREVAFERDLEGR